MVTSSSGVISFPIARWRPYQHGDTTMNVSNLDHLNLTVENLQESIQWYHALFGFSVVEQGNRSGTKWCIIRSGDALLCIYERPELEIGDYENDSHHRINHFGLRIQDRQAFEQAIKLNDVTVEYGGAVRYPNSWSWYIIDPSGHEIEVALWDNDRITFAA
jgi:catechol-2,3-dioxygenase